MKLGKKLLAFACLLLMMLAPPSRGEVLLRWTTGDIPPSKALGVNTVVIPWNADAGKLLQAARKQGYRVFVETTADSLEEIAEAAAKENAAGIVVTIDYAQRAAREPMVQKLRGAYPRLRILTLDARGKEPDMRGWLVFKKDGILQVSSPTSQPWIDSNLALVRFQRAFGPAQAALFTFSWDLSDPLRQLQGPSGEDYSLAVAEAGAFHADLILPIPENQQKALAQGDAEALETWSRVKAYLDFYGREQNGAASELPTPVGVLADDYDLSYEPLNLMARHNLGFRVLSPSAARKAKAFDDFDVLVVFATTDPELAKSIADFAGRGGIAVLVNLGGDFPWHASPPAKRNTHSVSYDVGRGRVIELLEPVIDPETFAQDIRRLTVKQRIPLSLWNSLTTLVAAYPGEKPGEVVVELLNYAQEPLEVQIQLKGNFDSARFENPENGCCAALKLSHVDGFTEFVVPDLKIAGRVHLSLPTPAADKSTTGKP